VPPSSTTRCCDSPSNFLIDEVVHAERRPFPESLISPRTISAHIARPGSMSRCRRDKHHHVEPGVTLRIDTGRRVVTRSHCSSLVSRRVLTILGPRSPAPVKIQNVESHNKKSVPDRPRGAASGPCPDNYS